MLQQDKNPIKCSFSLPPGVPDSGIRPLAEQANQLRAAVVHLHALLVFYAAGSDLVLKG